MKFTSLYGFFLLLCMSGYSQKTDTSVYLFPGLQAHYGFILPHSSAIEAISHTRPFGLELNLNRLNISAESREIFNTYWISGIQAGFFNFQNPEVLGNAYYATVFAEPVIIFREKYFVSIRGGGGISYHTRIFNSVENPSNLFFSTRTSFPIYLCARVNYKIDEKMIINVSGNYNHISNGGMKQPNYGMNFPTVSLGIQYFRDAVPVFIKGSPDQIKAEELGLSFLIQALSGYKVVDETDDYPEKGTLAVGLHARMAKSLTHYYALNAGAEIIIDGAIKESIRRQELDTDHKRFAMTVGQNFSFGKGVFTQYFGIYLYSPYKARHPFYQKYELGYKVHPSIMAGVFLKAHGHVAELMGVNISYILHK